MINKKIGNGVLWQSLSKFYLTWLEHNKKQKYAFRNLKVCRCNKINAILVVDIK